jgi:hypothetical protein
LCAFRADWVHNIARWRFPAAAFGTPGITTPEPLAVAIEMSAIIGRLHGVFDDGKELH